MPFFFFEQFCEDAGVPDILTKQLQNYFLSEKSKKSNSLNQMTVDTKFDCIFYSPKQIQHQEPRKIRKTTRN